MGSQRKKGLFIQRQHKTILFYQNRPIELFAGGEINSFDYLKKATIYANEINMNMKNSYKKKIFIHMTYLQSSHLSNRYGGKAQILMYLNLLIFIKLK